MNITLEALLKIAPQGNKPLLTSAIPFFNKYMPVYEINTINRVAYFFGQIAAESAGLRTVVEYASGKEYNNRTDLGNRKGTNDGVKYRGSGWIQCTGFYNFQHYGKILNLDLVNHPELAREPEPAVLITLEFWKEHKLNQYCDKQDIITLTRRINGGLHSLKDREIFTKRAKIVAPLILGLRMETPQDLIDLQNPDLNPPLPPMS